ncbi:hypothetical protein HB779_06680 [Phyllobacterium sp. 628]|uniref:hypothetical protein n=1 Tax=Phyllobacterium sp. 628 TaxID=2718938 RepID=UPI001662678C|nr:hypothetical protein [Phyllobacterium sp. 628]QND51617.1 hypothetical protein HB779_06680 [Phyllobacterium sp. 628]
MIKFRFSTFVVVLAIGSGASGIACGATLQSTRSLAAGIGGVPLILAAEKLGAPPRNPSGKITPPMTATVAQEFLDRDMATRFDAAADPATHQLTEQRARDFGWGFISDHFAEIDVHRQGYVRFEEVRAFMQARSPLAKPAPAAKGHAVQIIE